MKWLVVFLATVSAWSTAQAQASKTFQIRDGKLGVSIYYEDTLLNIGSNKLKVLIDQNTMDITIIVDKSTLRTGIDSLDSKLQSGTTGDIRFNGRIGLPQLWVKGKPVQHFDIPGTLTVNDQTEEILIEGSIRDYREGGVEMLLYMHYDLELAKFGLDKTLPGFASTGCIEMMQGVLVPSSFD